jgi:hypothetical protein
MKTEKIYLYEDREGLIKQLTAIWSELLEAREKLALAEAVAESIEQSGEDDSYYFIDEAALEAWKKSKEPAPYLDKDLNKSISSTPEEHKKVRLLKNSIQCKKCGDTLVSRHRHDFKSCSCDACFVDGGLDYMRVGGNNEDINDLSEWEEIE